MPTPLPRDDPDPFTVTCHAGFDESGFWLIDAEIKWRDGLPPRGSRLLGEGYLAMLTAIAREAQHGRSLGAVKVRVHMVGHSPRMEGTAEVFGEGTLDRTLPDPEPES